MSDLHEAETRSRDSFVEGVEVREGRNGEPTTLGGYAAVFNQETIIEAPGGVRWRERVSPSAFQEAIGRDDIIAAVNHDHKQVLGRTRNKTLTLSIDARGLCYDVRLPNTSLARDTVESVRRGDYTGSSFKFEVQRDGLRVEKPGQPSDLPLIVIERVKLIDVGPVTFPAYAGTSVSARGMVGVLAQLLEQATEHERVELRQRQKVRIAVERARAWAL